MAEHRDRQDELRDLLKQLGFRLPAIVSVTTLDGIITQVVVTAKGKDTKQTRNRPQ